MKTSTMLLSIAGLITLAMLTAYNFSLKASFQKGTYKNRFSRHELTNLKGIEQVKVNSANLISLNIEHGTKEGIWISDRVKSKIKFTQTGNALTIDLTDKAKENGIRIFSDDIFLIAHSVKKIQTEPYFKKNPEGNPYYPGETHITGFKQDSINLIIGISTNAFIDKMELDVLKASVGGLKEGNSSLTIASGNQINFADLSVSGESRLAILDPKIIKTKYNLSDKATVTLNGNALQQIKN